MRDVRIWIIVKCLNIYYMRVLEYGLLSENSNMNNNMIYLNICVDMQDVQ